ncbi:hypothetical protein Tco_1128927 [Tanacetum coccineum]
MWHDGSSSINIESGSNSEGIVAIVNKLENLGPYMKKLKENVYAIQVGCQTREGAHLDKDCPLNEEVKGMEEVKYGEFSRPFLNNIYDSRFNKGGHDQPSSGEKRPSLTEIIRKDIKVKKEQKPTRNEETSDQEKDLKPISKAGSRPWSRKDKKVKKRTKV